MTDSRNFVGTTIGLAVVAIAHALLTWPLFATATLFLGGATLAFVAEAVVVERGWLEHHVDPKLAGVPLYVLLGWPAAIYVALRVALLWTEGVAAVATAAGVATAHDVLVDNRGVSEGYWTYSDDLPGPRHGAVPWWNYAGWLAISGATAGVVVYLH